MKKINKVMNLSVADTSVQKVQAKCTDKLYPEYYGKFVNGYYYHYGTTHVIMKPPSNVEKGSGKYYPEDMEFIEIDLESLREGIQDDTGSITQKNQ